MAFAARYPFALLVVLAGVKSCAAAAHAGGRMTMRRETQALSAGVAPTLCDLHEDSFELKIPAGCDFIKCSFDCTPLCTVHVNGNNGKQKACGEFKLNTEVDLGNYKVMLVKNSTGAYKMQVSDNKKSRCELE